MAELTLESLAARVAALEEQIGRWPPAGGAKPRAVVRPGTGTWEEAFEAIEGLEDYDFDAVRRQDEVDWQAAREELNGPR